MRTANLGSRSDQVAAAEAEVKAREAALAKADWVLTQKRQVAPEAALIFDTLYSLGEWVESGHPVVVLLPPKNIIVRAYIPETMIGQIRIGQQAQISVDGVAASFEGQVSFISPQVEYTPPVIYSRESREKLVFLVEVALTPETAAQLHPGQPVDLQFTL